MNAINGIARAGCLVGLLLAQTGHCDPSQITGDQDNASLHAQLDALTRQVAGLEARIDREHDDVLNALLGQKVEEITKNCQSDQARCIAIAAWIAGNISNLSRFNQYSSSPEEIFATRLGLCGERARLFVKMCDVCNIGAKVWNIYNFGRVGGGHTVAEAFYDGHWHHFDMQYAGYFIRDGVVLSFADLQSHPEWAQEYMVPFSKPYTRNGDLQDFTQRYEEGIFTSMRQVYTPEALRESVGSAGLLGELPAKEIRIHIPAPPLRGKPISIGALDGANTDVASQGMGQHWAEQLQTLGAGSDFFTHAFIFSGAETKHKYYIDYHFCTARPELQSRFNLKPEHCTVLDGQKYDGSSEWKIIIQPTAAAFTVQIENDLKELGNALAVDSLEVGRMN